MAAKLFKTSLAVFVAWLIATGCATKRESGTLTGAAVGAAAGGALGDGSTTGMLIGAALGAVVGHEVGAEMDRRDRLRAARVLEYNDSYETSSWVNPDSGYEYQMTPVETYYRDDRTPCREFRMMVDMEGQPEEVYGTACRQPDGSWQVVS